MSGVYLLMVVAAWVGLTALLWKAWQRWRIPEGANRLLRDALALAIAVLWCGASFWYAGGQKVYYDIQVNQMCKQDGGVKVYEVVKLPAERFDKWGNVPIPLKDRAKQTDEYYIEWTVQYLKKGDPSLWRSHSRLVRGSDQKLLGESIMYARGGGDLPGPWHGSSFKCPEPTQGPSLESAVFSKGDGK